MSTGLRCKSVLENGVLAPQKANLFPAAQPWCDGGPLGVQSEGPEAELPETQNPPWLALPGCPWLEPHSKSEVKIKLNQPGHWGHLLAVVALCSHAPLGAVISCGQRVRCGTLCVGGCPNTQLYRNHNCPTAQQCRPSAASSHGPPSASISQPT